MCEKGLKQRGVRYTLDFEWLKKSPVFIQNQTYPHSNSRRVELTG